MKRLIKQVHTRCNVLGTDNYFYAIQVEGIDPSHVVEVSWRQIEADKKIGEWKRASKYDCIRIRGKRETARGQLLKWIDAVQPREFYAKWNMQRDDDSREIWYRL